MKSREYYRRNLPHYQPDGYAFFISFRLYGTLPVEVVYEFKMIKNRKLALISGYNNLKVRKEKYEEFKDEYFKSFDNYLDKCLTGNQWLRQKEVAEIVKEAIHYRDGREYNLISYTIMPNHVHLVFIPIVERDSSRFTGSVERDLSRSPDNLSDMNIALQYPVTDILRKLKGSTSRACNLVLNRSGAFWQHESYDHVVRDSDELKRIVNYVLNNPVKAGLAEYPEQWNYSYVNYDLIPVL